MKASLSSLGMIVLFVLGGAAGGWIWFHQADTTPPHPKRSNLQNKAKFAELWVQSRLNRAKWELELKKMEREMGPLPERKPTKPTRIRPAPAHIRSDELTPDGLPRTISSRDWRSFGLY